MTFTRLPKAEARQALADLVDDYAFQAATMEAPGSGYPEAQLRLDYIDKMLRILGWDVGNDAGAQHGLREVVVEQTLVDEGSTGRPDYRLRVAGRDRLPWEAKKPSVRLRNSKESAQQTRSYGLTLRLPAAVLTNFSELVIYDSSEALGEHQDAYYAEIPGCRFGYEEYIQRFDELWERLSHESVASEAFYDVYSYTEPPRGTSPFDRSFLGLFRGWRGRIAQSIHDEDPLLSAAEVGRQTQRLLNALLFLRVCEDRNISKYEDLLKSSQSGQLAEEFARSDSMFNAGLFRALSAIKIASAVLQAVVHELYWPSSKFAFGLLMPDTLASLYEQFLAERVEFAADGSVGLVAKPELTHAGGVVPTPDVVVADLVRRALDPYLLTGQPVPVDLTALDPGCGSGVFLVAVLQQLLQVQERASGAPLDLSARGALAKRHIFGVDLDGEAVEVARLSLLLLVLGDDPVDVTSAHAILPDLNDNIRRGNALVSNDFDKLVPLAATIPDIRAAVAPFDWAAAFPSVTSAGGFTCVLGNPPYVRIQVLAAFMPEQLDYFKNPASGYLSATSHNFDVYMLFVERSLSLLRADGTLAFIVKHGFTSSPSGSPLRGILAKRLQNLVHFGVHQLFPGRLTYTCLVVASGHDQTSDLEVALVSDPGGYLTGVADAATDVSFPRDDLDDSVWPMASASEAAIFTQMESVAVGRLGEVGWVDIFVGVQTSADPLYLLRVVKDVLDQPHVQVVDKDGKSWPIERGILRPAIRDVPLALYGDQPDGDYVAIFPYDVSLPLPGRKRGRATPFDLAKMEASFPLTLEYLRHHEAGLRKRAAKLGAAFWAYGRNQNTWKMDGPKIVNRTMSVVPQYVPDRRDHVVPGGGSGPYTLLRPTPQCPLSIEVVIALLSHPVVDAFVAARARAFHGGYVVHAKTTLKDIPIPPLPPQTVSALEDNAQELQRLEHRLRTEHDSVVRTSIVQRRTYLVAANDASITEAFGLTEAQVSQAFG